MVRDMPQGFFDSPKTVSGSVACFWLEEKGSGIACGVRTRNEQKEQVDYAKGYSYSQLLPVDGHLEKQNEYEEDQVDSEFCNRDMAFSYLCTCHAIIWKEGPGAFSDRIYIAASQSDLYCSGGQG